MIQSNNGPSKIQWMLNVIYYEMINTQYVSCTKRTERCSFTLCDDNIGANSGFVRLPLPLTIVASANIGRTSGRKA